MLQKLLNTYTQRIKKLVFFDPNHHFFKRTYIFFSCDSDMITLIAHFHVKVCLFISSNLLVNQQNHLAAYIKCVIILNIFARCCEEATPRASGTCLKGWRCRRCAVQSRQSLLRLLTDTARHGVALCFYFLDFLQPQPPTVGWLVGWFAMPSARTRR